MKSLWIILRPHILPYQRKLGWALFLALPFAAIKGAQVLLVKQIVNNLNAQSELSNILISIMTLIFLGLINYPCRFFHFYLMKQAVEGVILSLRSYMFDKLQKLPLNYFNAQKTGTLISNITSDTLLLGEGLKNSIDLVREPLTAFVMLCMAIYSDWQLTLVILITAPCFILIFQKSGKMVRNNQTRVQAELAQMTHALQEGIVGQKVIKAFNLQNYFLQRFKKAQASFYEFQMKTAKVEENAHPLVELVGTFAFSGVILFAFFRIKNHQITTGDFFSFVTSLALLMDPLRKYSQANVKINQALAAKNRLNEMLVLPEEPMGGEIEVSEFREKIEIKNLNFSFGDSVVLKNFSLTINKGEKVALVGASGSGKSTLINLLLGLYPAPAGTFFIDGRPYEDYNLRSIRSLFGLVSQDMFLFHDTVAENIATDLVVTPGEIIEVASDANALTFIKELPREFETIIGDRGVLLSGGQCQRLTIARAMLKNPNVLLLDEATSALDSVAEREVQKAINNFDRSKTVVAVAHRLSTIQDFDRIVVLDQGVKIEEGTHQDLMGRLGTYSYLYQLTQKQI